MRRKGGILRVARRPARVHKYRARPCWVDVRQLPWSLTPHEAVVRETHGDTKAAIALGESRGWELCASTAEATRYRELLVLQYEGKISSLSAQPRYELAAKSGGRVGFYVADFVYKDALGETVIEDVKGFKTALYAWKKRHMKAQYGIEIHEVTRR